jgi:CubicO group peptidase (beta-lactamase class C family)
VAVAVISRGEVLVQRGYGIADLQTRRPVTAVTPFNIASLTKPFTAVVAARLADAGVVDLDASVAGYLPDLPDRYAPVTLRHLLTHTSGVDRDLREDNLDDPTADEYRFRLDTASMHAAVGERWEYSNNGYTILGWALAAAAGKPMGELFADHIFEPLAMHQARYRASLTEDPERARPHHVTRDTVTDAPYITGGFASGGLSMSIADLARFAVALQAKDHLTASQVARLWEPALLTDGTPAKLDMFGSTAGYGFGWFLARFEDRSLMTHGGGISGFSSNLYHFPEEELSIAVLANAKERDDGRAPVDVLARKIAAACFARDACRPISGGRLPD